MKYSYLESMKKQQDKSKMFEAKQVGDLYHVCSLKSLSKFIAPTDTLQGCGKYNNWLLGGDTDIVSFTRDSRFILHTWRDDEYPVVFQFKVDGNKLSENYKVFPYNDFHYDVANGIPVATSYTLGASIPSCTTYNNGQVLCVVNGVPVWQTINNVVPSAEGVNF